MIWSVRKTTASKIPLIHHWSTCISSWTSVSNSMEKANTASINVETQESKIIEGRENTGSIEYNLMTI